jgi:nicotinamidase/pyrazinamidase
VDALIIVDVQNDFTPGGRLPVPHGDEVIEAVNTLASRYELVVASRDWHPVDHASFAEQGGIWPRHCVADSEGAQLAPGVDRELIDVIVDKGRSREADGYSAFEDTGLDELLRSTSVDTVHVAGLALDYCVRATALDARRAGFDVVLHRSATRAVDVHEGDGERAVAEMRSAGVKVVD